MSRGAFSIRKLITQRRTWPESDSDNEEAFECSSAKTIRMQYELEQYQQQQLQNEHTHAHKTRSSWISSNSSPRRKADRKLPSPIIVTGHNSNDIVLHSGSASRRISTPLTVSSRPGLISPELPHSHSDSSLCSGQRHHRHQRHHSHSNTTSCAAGSYSKPRLSTPPTTTAGWISPGIRLCPSMTASLVTKKAPREDHSFLSSAQVYPPYQGLSRSNQDVTSPQQPRPGPNSGYTPHNKSPIATKTSASSTLIAPNGNLIAMHSHKKQEPTYVNSSESYTLDPPLVTGDANNRHVAGSEVLRALHTPSKVSEEDDQTDEGFFGGRGDEDCSHLPDNIQQLIQRTDEAFKAVDTALAEARLASQSFPQSKELQAQVQHLQLESHALQIQTMSLDNTVLQTLPSTTYQAPMVRTQNNSGVTSPVSSTAGRGSIMPFPRKNNNKPSPVSSSDDILRSPTHATSIKKTKRKSPARPKTPRSAMAPALTPTPTTTTWPDTPAPTAKASTFSPSSTKIVSGESSAQRQPNSHRSFSRWNLKADNVTEKLFHGSRGRFGFHKIEADEVVTPGQVQQYRQSRIAKAEAEAQAETRRSNSYESLRSTAGSVGGVVSDANRVNTHVEPFHAQDLPLRIANSGANLGVLSPVAEVLTPKSFTFDLDKDASRKSSSTEPKTPPTATKQIKQGQTPLATPLATPPPTPPESSPNARPSASTPYPEEDASFFLSSNSFPDPFVKESSHQNMHKRGNSSTSRVPIMSTIPEVRITSPQGQSNLSKTRSGRGPSEIHMEYSLSPLNEMNTPFFEDDDEYLYFRSVPFTVTMPTFEHGRIRLAKADLVNAGRINSLESKLLSSPDETLDWTAFQMAILGGAGDLSSDPSDLFARDAQEELADDLCDWFEGFGLPAGALGTLVLAEKESAAKKRPVVPCTAPPQISAISPPGPGNRSFHNPNRNHSINHIVNRSISSCSESVRSSGEVSEKGQDVLQVRSKPMPISPEHPSGLWNTGPFDESRFYTGNGCGIKRWTLEGHPKRYQGPSIDVGKANTLQRRSPRPSPDGLGERRDSDDVGSRRGLREGIDSLPQSPMLDLVMTTGVDGSKEYVPMGYNLGHDLGDFLKWESENVYATAFYGSD